LCGADLERHITEGVREPYPYAVAIDCRTDHHANRLLVEHRDGRQSRKWRRSLQGRAPRAHPVFTPPAGLSICDPARGDREETHSDDCESPVRHFSSTVITQLQAHVRPSTV